NDFEMHARNGFFFEHDVVGVVFAGADDIGGDLVLAAALASLDDHELALGQVNRAGDVVARGNARLGLDDAFFHPMRARAPIMVSGATRTCQDPRPWSTLPGGAPSGRVRHGGPGAGSCGKRSGPAIPCRANARKAGAGRREAAGPADRSAFVPR